MSSITNVEYGDKGLRVWRAYGVGGGKLISWDNLNLSENLAIPSFTDVNKKVYTKFHPCKKEV